MEKVQKIDTLVASYEFPVHLGQACKGHLKWPEEDDIMLCRNCKDSRKLHTDYHELQKYLTCESALVYVLSFFSC